MTAIRGIIFDMDGVLIDAKEWHYEALNRALGLFGHHICRQAHESGLDGLPTREKLLRLSASQVLPIGLHGLINHMKQIYTLQIAAERCHPVSAHHHALENLRAQGYRLAVASNSVRESVDVMLRLAGLQRYLDFSLSNEDVRQGKPHPEIYQNAIARMKLLPQECLVVEDNPHGIEAAAAAGAYVLHVDSPDEVRLSRILSFIESCENRSKRPYSKKRTDRY